MEYKSKAARSADLTEAYALIESEENKRNL